MYNFTKMAFRVIVVLFLVFSCAFLLVALGISPTLSVTTVLIGLVVAIAIAKYGKLFYESLDEIK